MAPVFVKRHAIAESAHNGTPRATHGSHAAHELHWFLTQPHFARTAALCAESALETGVELRAPMLDMRVVRLAASRPPSERRSRAEVKILLRRAMRDLLPDRVLASRPFKTGTLATYFNQSLASLAPTMRAAFRDPLLAALGIASRDGLQIATERYLTRGGTGYIAEQLVSALQCELWLKARLHGAQRNRWMSRDPVSVTMSASALGAHASGTSRQLSRGGL
jgi:asparagine synthetase B (glutamine-hydrolysing)